MTVELLVAVLLYGGLGFLADRWLGSGPWLASIGTLVGLGAGLYLVWLRSERTGQEQHGGAGDPRR
jgi:F0F1-type ATP synthase assembly protein I